MLYFKVEYYTTYIDQPIYEEEGVNEVSNTSKVVFLSPGGEFGQTFDLLWVLQLLRAAQTHQNTAGHHRLQTKSWICWAPHQR